VPIDPKSVTFKELLAETGDHLGYGYGSDDNDPAWSERTEKRIRRAVAGGVRQVYYPPALPGEKVPHLWSFLRPQATFFLADGAYSVQMPEDFGGVEGKIYPQIGTANTTACEPVLMTSMEALNDLRNAAPASTGRPCYAAERRTKDASAVEPRSYLEFFPIADRDYTMRLQYYFSPAVTDGTGDYLLGGPELGDLFKVSVKAWADVHYDNVDPRRSGLYALFQERLAAGVAIDRRRKGVRLGYNGDRGGRVWGGSARSGLRLGVNSVTYDGQVW
jgi:hypothetical protein